MFLCFKFKATESYPDMEFGQANVSGLFHKLLEHLRFQALIENETLSKLDHEIIDQKCHFIKKLCWDLKCVSETNQELYFELIIPSQYKEHFCPTG